MSVLAALALSLLVAPVPAQAAPLARPAQQSFSGVIAAVDSCFASVSLTGLDVPRLARDGWSEVKVDNVEKSPHPFKLFRKDGSGTIMMVNFTDEGRPHCHVMIVRTAGTTDQIGDALVDHLGGPFLPGDQGLGEGNRAMRVHGKPFILVLRPQPEDKDFMAEIHIMPIGEDEQ